MNKTALPSIDDAKVLKSEQLAEDIYALHLHSPKVAATAQPGQFIMLQLVNSLDPLLRRPFSIHRCHRATGELVIAYKVVGKGTKILSRIPSGTSLSVLGPLGNGFRLDSANRNQPCLVGGGMGIAPLLFLADELASQDSRPLILLGGRTATELLAVENFNRLGQLQLATDDGSEGQHGFVSQLLEGQGGKALHIYCCGPQPMMKVIAEICRQNKWPCQLSLESHMACGMGACLGCAVERAELTTAKEKKYLHVCSDGPVFEAGEVWL